MSAQPAPRIFSTVFGLLMAAAAAAPADGPALLAAALAAFCVLAGLFIRPAATIAVLAALAALALSEPAPLFAGLSGLSAAAYLVIRHAVGVPDMVTTTRPTVLGATGFTLAGLVAVSLPAHVAWLPLLAPVAVATVYLLAIRHYLDLTAQYLEVDPAELREQRLVVAPGPLRVDRVRCVHATGSDAEGVGQLTGDRGAVALRVPGRQADVLVEQDAADPVVRRRRPRPVPADELAVGGQRARPGGQSEHRTRVRAHQRLDRVGGQGRDLVDGGERDYLHRCPIRGPWRGRSRAAAAGSSTRSRRPPPARSRSARPGARRTG